MECLFYTFRDGKRLVKHGKCGKVIPAKSLCQIQMQWSEKGRRAVRKQLRPWTFISSHTRHTTPTSIPKVIPAKSLCQIQMQWSEKGRRAVIYICTSMFFWICFILNLTYIDITFRGIQKKHLQSSIPTGPRSLWRLESPPPTTSKRKRRWRIWSSNGKGRPGNVGFLKVGLVDAGIIDSYFLKLYIVQYNIYITYIFI